MKAAVCETFGKPLVLKEVPEPTVGPDEVLIRIKGCGVCHSDLHLVDGDWKDWGTPLPIIPGHEVTGVVESQAPLVREYSPHHAMADQDGYIYRPNVNVVEEMANMISASRAYQNNVEVVNATNRSPKMRRCAPATNVWWR